MRILHGIHSIVFICVSEFIRWKSEWRNKYCEYPFDLRLRKQRFKFSINDKMRTDNKLRQWRQTTFDRGLNCNRYMFYKTTKWSKILNSNMRKTNKNCYINRTMCACSTVIQSYIFLSLFDVHSYSVLIPFIISCVNI